MVSLSHAAQKPLEFIGSSKEALSAFPADVKRVIGHALHLAQIGGKAEYTKPLSGDPVFRGATAMEIVDDFDGETYRAVYTVKFAGVVYVLHAFQKKSKKGIATPRHEVALIKARLKRAQEHFKENYRTVRLG